MRNADSSLPKDGLAVMLANGTARRYPAVSGSDQINVVGLT